MWLPNKYIRFTLVFVLFFGAHAPLFAQIEVTTKELETHLKFLTSSKNKGRFPGTKESYRVEKYLAKHFSKAKLTCFNHSYFQRFNAKLKFTNTAVTSNEVSACNVLGLIEGSDSILKKELIIIGAHYDHLGFGGRASKKPDTIAVHPGADDNASGTSALLEIAERISANRHFLSGVF